MQLLFTIMSYIMDALFMSVKSVKAHNAIFINGD